jgi:hypothetical protein
MAHPRGVAVSMVFMMVALLTLMVTTPVPASQAPPTSASYPTAIMQLIAGVGTFTGTLTTSGFTLANGVISAVGTIGGKLTDTTGNVIATVSSQPVTILLTSFTGTCTTLTLHTGPMTNRSRWDRVVPQFCVAKIPTASGYQVKTGPTTFHMKLIIRRKRIEVVSRE